jgi:hypothetical protein
MYGLIREEGSLGSNPGAKDLARHLFSRMACGKAVVVADRPNVMYASLRKQWLKLARKVSKEQSSTLNASRLLRLSGMAACMQTMRFTTDWPDDYTADVAIATVEQLLQWSPDCRTMYVTCEVSIEQLHLITAMMPKGSLVVLGRFV